MKTPDLPAARIRVAIALSIALHWCAFALLAAFFGSPHLSLSSELDAGAATFVTTFRRERAATPRPVIAVRTALPRTEVAPTPQSARRPARTAAAPLVAVPRRAAPAAADPPPAAGSISLALVVSEPSPTQVPTSTPIPVPTATIATPAPTPSPTPTAAATAAPVVAANFGGLFSQNYPPALAAPADLAPIRARLAGPVRIRVEVDETGHATDVHVVRPAVDEEIAQAIRATLLGLRYVPADCNGLHCDGTLDITY